MLAVSFLSSIVLSTCRQKLSCKRFFIKKKLAAGQQIQTAVLARYQAAQHLFPHRLTAVQLTFVGLFLLLLYSSALPSPCTHSPKRLAVMWMYTFDIQH